MVGLARAMLDNSGDVEDVVMDAFVATSHASSRSTTRADFYAPPLSTDADSASGIAPGASASLRRGSPRSWDGAHRCTPISESRFEN